MTGTEWLRFAVIIVGGINLGLMAAIFEKVGRYFVPHTAMRAIMAGVTVVTLSLVIGSILHFHTPPPLILYGLFAGLIVKTGGLLIVFRWYDSEPGQQHMQAMIGSVRANGRRVK